MPFNVNKCHILHVGTRNQKFDYKMTDVKLESVQCIKYFSVSTASNLKLQQCKIAAGKANRMLGFINRNFSFKNKDKVYEEFGRELGENFMNKRKLFWKEVKGKGCESENKEGG